MSISITMELSDLQSLIAERDKLRDRIAQLEATPLAFSLARMANDLDHSGVLTSLTPSQAATIRDAIEGYRAGH